MLSFRFVLFPFWHNVVIIMDIYNVNCKTYNDSSDGHQTHFLDTMMNTEKYATHWNRPKSEKREQNETIWRHLEENLNKRHVSKVRANRLRKKTVRKEYKYI